MAALSRHVQIVVGDLSYMALASEELKIWDIIILNHVVHSRLLPVLYSLCTAANLAQEKKAPVVIILQEVNYFCYGSFMNKMGLYIRHVSDEHKILKILAPAVHLPPPGNLYNMPDKRCVVRRKDD